MILDFWLEMIQQLERYLFRSSTHTYAVLDGASVPDLPVRLYEMRPPNVCLYRGELQPDIAYVAPYLVHLLPKTEFTNWLFSECWGKHWGIFAQSGLSLNGMRKHFRSLLIVNDSNGNPLLFRYYDPRAFLTFLPTCNAAELQNFFGRVNHYFVESDDASRLYRFRFANNELKKTNLVMKQDDQ
jgi:hypothetical protein